MHTSSMQADQPTAAALVSRRYAIASIASLAAAGLPVSAWAVAQTQVIVDLKKQFTELCIDRHTLNAFMFVLFRSPVGSKSCGMTSMEQ
jgi:hypothetical protein